jgi:hypothetical protein
MRKFFFTLFLSFLISFLTFGQSKTGTCDCPKTKFAGTKADTTFHFSHGEKIVLCGYKNLKTRPTTFSEFILFRCGEKQIIDFWGAAKSCQLKIEHDTLFVKQIENLPVGKTLNFQPTVWTIEKFYFKEKKFIRKLLVNKQIPKYNQSIIKMVVKSFENEKNGLNDNKMELANKLFIASISGDKTSRKHFKEFKTKFGVLDGAFLEEYNHLNVMLRVWDGKNRKAY